MNLIKKNNKKQNILIFKNDRTGDRFTSLKAMNKILNKHKNDNIEIILSKLNYKFHFVFNKINYMIFPIKT